LASRSRGTGRGPRALGQVEEQRPALRRILRKNPVAWSGRHGSGCADSASGAQLSRGSSGDQQQAGAGPRPWGGFFLTAYPVDSTSPKGSRRARRARTILGRCTSLGSSSATWAPVGSTWAVACGRRGSDARGAITARCSSCRRVCCGGVDGAGYSTSDSARRTARSWMRLIVRGSWPSPPIFQG
jgi:hypothetical protein